MASLETAATSTPLGYRHAQFRFSAFNRVTEPILEQVQALERWMKHQISNWGKAAERLEGLEVECPKNMALVAGSKRCNLLGGLPFPAERWFEGFEGFEAGQKTALNTLKNRWPLVWLQEMQGACMEAGRVALERLAERWRV